MKLCLNILVILCILGVVCLIIVTTISYIENRKLVTTSYQIKDNLIPKDFHNYHIVHLSDMHNTSFDIHNKMLIEGVRQLHPDIILITGDMIIGKPDGDVDFAAETINELCGIAPVYFSMGNHELRASIYTDTYGIMWKKFCDKLSPEVNLLLDKKVIIQHGEDFINLYGLNLTPKLYKRIRRTPMNDNYLKSIFGECNPKEYHIFMAHNPDYFTEYANWGANLTFSGHVHGGMIRLPFLGGVISPMVHLFPKYDKGLFINNNKYMILSGGLGNHTLKIRVNNLPEIVSVTLYHETM